MRLSGGLAKLRMSQTKRTFDNRVAVAEVQPEYPLNLEPEACAEIAAAVKRIATELRWSDEQTGPFGRLIPAGARVLVKPNFVLHQNQGPWEMDPMVTHESLVSATVNAALQTEAGEVLVGDAPIQTCDFARLLEATQLGDWSQRMMKSESRFKGIKDFRRTVAETVKGVRVAQENLLPEDQFVLFDLEAKSLLEPVTNKAEDFRVTCYDPRLMAQTHAPGRHRYLVAREVMDADVVINLPKLKTHKKAGITCALKNIIGINGNKEYLPHHRLGGSNLGGDCYPGDSRLKRMLEYVADQQNISDSAVTARFWSVVARNLNRALHVKGDSLGIEGSWDGNDTIWRTALDLNRIIVYGRVDGTMAEEPQRKIIHLADAVVAGQGDGPLSPQPLKLGVLFGGNNAAAVDWVGARLLGYDPQQLSIVREAFGKFSWPLASFAPADIEIAGDWSSDAEVKLSNRQAIYPEGWRRAANNRSSDRRRVSAA